MYLLYFDESGDTGHITKPNATDRFIFVTVRVHETTWLKGLQNHDLFRAKIEQDFKLPQTREMHTRKFIKGKSDYYRLYLKPEERMTVITKFCEFISTLGVHIHGDIFHKNKGDYAEMDLRKFRNIIPSEIYSQSLNGIYDCMVAQQEIEHLYLYADGEALKGELIKFFDDDLKWNTNDFNNKARPYLIDQPLFQNSAKSPYIQVADFVATIMHYYTAITVDKGSSKAKIEPYVTEEIVHSWLEILKPVLCDVGSNEYGIIDHFARGK